MGMSTHIEFFKPPDEKWQQMKAVWDACEKAGIDPPDEVDDFFDGEAPNDAGVKVDAEEDEAVEELEEDGTSGFKVDITKLPKDVRFIIFYNAW